MELSTVVEQKSEGGFRDKYKKLKEDVVDL